MRTRGNMYDRPWKKALLDMSKIGTTTKSIGNPYVGDYELLTDTGARCFPDGFPVAVYLNGAFYGIFSYQLKKHRDNYHLNKSSANNVHLDGALGANTIFNGKDNIDWTQFEIRNPKGLYTIGGNKYNADIKQEEIAGDSEINSWISIGSLPNGTTISSKIKKNLQNTALVKKYIQNLADAIPAIKAAMNKYDSSSHTNENLNEFKSVFESYFDKDNLIDYIIISDIIKNADGLNKNWQWFTYNGKKWWVGLYDCDQAFGGTPDGTNITTPLTTHLDTGINIPTGYIFRYYSDELNNRYKFLADKGIITSEYVFGELKNWTMRIGTSFYEKEYSKWNDSPCISDSEVRSDYWEIEKDEKGIYLTSSSETFDATISYDIGDEVSFGINSIMGFYKYRCIKKTTALSYNKPHTISSFCPLKQFKHCDSLYRAQKWIMQNIENLDKVYNYTR